MSKRTSIEVMTISGRIVVVTGGGAEIGAESSLSRPHPQVADCVQRKAAAHDRWLRGVMRMRRRACKED